MENSEWLTRAGCLKSTSLQTLLQNHFSWNCSFISKNLIYIVSPASIVIRDINCQTITCTSCLIYLDLKSSCFTILRAVCLMNFCLMHFFVKKTSISFSLSLSLSLFINVVLLISDRRTFWEGFMFVYTVLQPKIFFFCGCIFETQTMQSSITPMCICFGILLLSFPYPVVRQIVLDRSKQPFCTL